VNTVRCPRCRRFTNKLLIRGEWTRICVCSLPGRGEQYSSRIPRYAQVANLKATGMTIAAIARHLNITQVAATIAWHRAQRKAREV
jgi:hypothetical protein